MGNLPSLRASSQQDPKANTSSLFLSIPVTASLIASLLFMVQGGFGIGEKALDPFIWVSGLPAILLMLMGFPIPSFVQDRDFVLFIW